MMRFGEVLHRPGNAGVTPADQPAAIMRLFQRLKDHGIAVTEIIERGYGKAISFLLISVENAPGATRFANGDWTDLSCLMPLIGRAARLTRSCCRSNRPTRLPEPFRPTVRCTALASASNRAGLPAKSSLRRRRILATEAAQQSSRRSTLQN